MSYESDWSCTVCTYKNPGCDSKCQMCENPRPTPSIPINAPITNHKQKMSSSMDSTANGNANSSPFGLKKLMGNLNVATSSIGNSLNTSGLFASKSNSNTASMAQSSDAIKGKSQKSVAELEDEIEILKMQKKDLRQLVQERTYQLDQMKKLDAEHQSLRDRWKSNEEKAVNEVEVMESQTESLQKEIETLKQENAALQSKQTNNDLIKNELENKVNEMEEEERKRKKARDRAQREKQMLVAEVLKLRNEKQEMLEQHKEETDKLNRNNSNNIDHLTEHFKIERENKEREHKAQCKELEMKYNELNTIYGHYQQNVRDKVSHIDSTTSAFENMIQNANMGSLSQTECNKILDNIIHSIEDMERENKLYHQRLERKRKRNQPIQDLLEYDVDHDLDDDDDDDDDRVTNGEELEMKSNGMKTNGMSLKRNGLNGKGKDMDEEMLLNEIESRVLKALREKALLQRSSNELMYQLQQLQVQHEKEVKEKNDVIRQYELKAKVTFFKKKQPKNPKP